jgi:hypothetical protein
MRCAYFYSCQQTIYLLSCLGSSVERHNQNTSRSFECYTLSAYINKSFAKSAIHRVGLRPKGAQGLRVLRMESTDSWWRVVLAGAGKKYKFSLYIYTHWQQTNYNLIIQSTTEGPDWSTLQRGEAAQEALQRFRNDSVSHKSPHPEFHSWIGFWIAF